LQAPRRLAAGAGHAVQAETRMLAELDQAAVSQAQVDAALRMAGETGYSGSYGVVSIISVFLP
jgi:hypothetical protein